MTVDGLADVFRLVVRDAEKKNHAIVGRVNGFPGAKRMVSGLELTWGIR